MKASDMKSALSELREILYLDSDIKMGFVLDPDKEHDSDTMARINDLAIKYRLCPNRLIKLDGAKLQCREE